MNRVRKNSQRVLPVGGGERIRNYSDFFLINIYPMKQVLIALMLMIALFVHAAPFGFVEARRTNIPVKIDGELECTWLDGANTYNLRHYNGKIDNVFCVENYLTILRLLWDDQYLYVSFVCSDNEVTANYMKHDDPIYKEDICEVILQRPNSRYCLEVSISPQGVIYDALFYWDCNNRINVDTSYTLTGLLTAVQKKRIEHKLVWIVEMAIPWNAIPGFVPCSGAKLMSNFLRYERLTNSELIIKNSNSSFLPLSVFSTGIRGWPAGSSSQRPMFLIN